MSTMGEGAFVAIHGDGSRERCLKLIDELAPVTRRDEWWATDGPYEIIAKHLGRVPSKDDPA